MKNLNPFDRNAAKKKNYFFFVEGEQKSLLYHFQFQKKK